MGAGYSSPASGIYRMPPEIKDFNDQSKADQPEGTRRSYLQPDGKLMESCDPTVTTVYENFLYGHKIARDKDCLGYRPTPNSPYQWISYNEVLTRAKKVGSALVHLGLQPEPTTFVGIYAVNCVEWVLTSLGCQSQRMTIVPLYDTLGAEAVKHIVNQTGMSVIVCGNYTKAKALLDIAADVPTVKTLVVIKEDIERKKPAEGKQSNDTDKDTIVAAAKSQAKERGINLHLYTDLYDIGGKNPTPEHPPKPDDLFMICYTSGTTGQPKGAQITHRGMLAVPHAVKLTMEKFNCAAIGPDKSVVSYLPLAHIFEQAVHVIMFLIGGKIGFFSGDTKKLMDDIKVLQPHIFPVVPRLLGLLYDKVQANLAKASYVEQALFNYGYNWKLSNLKQGVIDKNSIWDRLIFKKIQAQLGGNVEFVVTGAAPISTEVLELCRVALGCVIVEGYGQTECSAACSMTLLGDANAGHVGVPLPCNKIRLVDVPDMEYFAKDNKGEVCIYGPNVMRGYYKEEEKTREAIDADGWLHTGDIGQWLPNGTLKIIDRKKNIFKLAQGEYVAPEKIEQVYQRMPQIAQVFVDGLSTQRHLIAVVIPELEACKQWAMKNGQTDTTIESLCANDALREHILKEMDKFGKENKLNSIEQVKAIHLHPEPFTLENDLLTPTLKAKRPQLRKYFQSAIEALYADNKTADTSK